jgi:hypothetical protein
VTHRKRIQLIAALLIAPVVLVLPFVWPEWGEPHFVSRNLDILLIFVAAPYAAALWLYFNVAKPPRS